MQEILISLLSIHFFKMETGYPVIPIYFALPSATCNDNSGKVCVITISKFGSNSIS